MNIFYFAVGLAIGLSFWAWQRSRSDARIKVLLHELRSHRSQTEGSSFSSTSQLAIAIARQQQTYHHLEQEVEGYKQVLHAAPIGYLQVDDENRLLWCNPQARQLLGMTQDFSPRPRLLLELVRSYELDQLIEQTRNAGKPCHSDWMVYPVSPDPSDLVTKQAYAVRGHGFPLLDNQVGIFLEDRQEAVMLMQQRDRWASDVAHELKTPLTSIRLVAETLQTRLEPALQGWVNRLINEVIRLSNLVQDLLDLSQIERGSFQSLQLKTVDLVELIHTAWLNLEPLARKKHLQLNYCGVDRLLIQVDEPRIYRVLLNLLDNSIKYSPPRQKIQVQVSIEPIEPDHNPLMPQYDQQICLEVIDAGPGFPEEAIAHVFERFYRVDPSRCRVSQSEGVRPLFSEASAIRNDAATTTETTEPSQHQSGSGLGLAIVKQIVEAHYGSVTASNHPDTGGAWLKVCLPWHQPDQTN